MSECGVPTAANRMHLTHQQVLAEVTNERGNCGAGASDFRNMGVRTV